MYEETLQRTLIDSGDWIRGARSAPVTMLEYGDFECPHCAAARLALEGLVEAAPDTIRLVYRHFPVTSIHPHAAMAAEAAEAAGAQGRFWQMHDMIFSSQPDLEYEDLRWCAEQVGCDMVRYEDELAARAYRDEVRRDFNRGIQDGVNGTPTIFINGRRHDGPRDPTSLAAAIARQGRMQHQDLHHP